MLMGGGLVEAQVLGGGVRRGLLDKGVLVHMSPERVHFRGYTRGLAVATGGVEGVALSMHQACTQQEAMEGKSLRG
jgi:hypothetical protein